jgi:hypothetical protein
MAATAHAATPDEHGFSRRSTRSSILTAVLRPGARERYLTSCGEDAPLGRWNAGCGDRTRWTRSGGRFSRDHEIGTSLLDVPQANHSPL